MISKTKISKRQKRKTNSGLVKTIEMAKKNKEWNKVAQILSGSTKKQSSVNLKNIEKEVKEGDTVIVLGKVLGTGKVSKRVKVCALSFSEKARHKLKENKSEAVILLEEIKANPRMEGIKIIR